MLDSLTSEVLTSFQAHATREAPRECCGLVIEGHGYVACRNVLDGTEGFELDAVDWDAAEDLGPVLAVCHSHPGASAEPSRYDLVGCKESGLPWFILGGSGQLRRVDPSEGEGVNCSFLPGEGITGNNLFNLLEGK